MRDGHSPAPHRRSLPQDAEAQDADADTLLITSPFPAGVSRGRAAWRLLWWSMALAGMFLLGLQGARLEALAPALPLPLPIAAAPVTRPTVAPVAITCAAVVPQGLTLICVQTHPYARVQLTVVACTPSLADALVHVQDIPDQPLDRVTMVADAQGLIAWQERTKPFTCAADRPLRMALIRAEATWAGAPRAAALATLVVPIT